MKARTYQARQLDPRTLVVTHADYLKAIETVKAEAIKAFDSLHKINKIDKSIKEYLIDRIKKL